MGEDTKADERAPRRVIAGEKQKVFEYAVRETCVTCGKEFWHWPGSEREKCAACLWRAGVGYRIPRTESP